MAAQTEAPDDLIAELARLMADDAKGTQPQANEPSSPVRIPGETPVVPVPRFDFSASSNTGASQAPTSPVRIPGGEPAKSETSAPAEPFSFNFDFAPSIAAAKTATPAAPAPVSTPVPPVPAEEPGPLDHDSLADLIAAELAADLTPEPVRQPAPAAPAAPVLRPASEDNFGVPPVFGLGSAQPAPVAAPVEPQPAPQPAPLSSPVQEALPPTEEPDTGNADEALDPLEEIERLVAPAVRMNTASPAPSPALRSLATPVAIEPTVAVEVQPERPAPAPRPEPAVRQEPLAPAAKVSTAPQINSVDDAILAAAAATGAHVEWVDAGAQDAEDVAVEDEPFVAPARSRGFRMSRAVAGPLVAVSLLAVAGFGLYWALGQGGTTTGPAPLVVADAAPTKEVPEVDSSASAQQSVVFNEISGGESGVDEQIVSRDQADTEAVVAANTPVPNSGVIADQSSSTVDPNQDGLVNRKVRTVTVRPDGTIVSGDDSMAGSAILPVDRPNVPNVPGADFSTPDLIASATADSETAQAAVATPAETTPAPAAPAAEPGSVVAVVDTAGSPISGRTVTIPMQRPSNFSTLAAAAIASANAAPAVATQPTATAPTQQAVISTPAPSGNAAAYVQLASQRSEDEAQRSAQAVATRFGVLFGGATPEIHRVDLGERGIYYRVLVPTASREAAANICTNVKAAGGDCLLL